MLHKKQKQNCRPTANLSPGSGFKSQEARKWPPISVSPGEIVVCLQWTSDFWFWHYNMERTLAAVLK